MIPESYHHPIPSVAPLSDHATVGELGSKLDGQTSNLSRANGRTADVIEIAKACDDRQAEAARILSPPHPKWMFWAR